MRGQVRVAVVVVAAAVALTAAGCRQLFGIDDTQVGDDDGRDGPVSDAPPLDAIGPVNCAEDHVLCMDFDTPETGISQLPLAQTIGMADIVESDAMDAPSPPRVLVASSPANSEPAGIFRAQQFVGDTVGSSAVSFWLRVPDAPMGDCNPGLFVLAWSLLDPAYQVSLSVGTSGLELRVDVQGVAQVNVIPFDRDEWTPVYLDVSLTTGAVKLDTPLAGTTIDALELTKAKGRDALVALGIGLETAHGDCAAEFDDFTLDSPPPGP